MRNSQAVKLIKAYSYISDIKVLCGKCGIDKELLLLSFNHLLTFISSRFISESVCFLFVDLVLNCFVMLFQVVVIM